MDRPKPQAGETETDCRLVRRLLRHQFPHWADLPSRQASHALAQVLAGP